MNRHIFLALTLIYLAGCGSMGRKLDASRAKAVKKVAILSVEVQQQQPKDALGLNKFKEMKGGPLRESAEFQGLAKNIYQQLAQSMAKQSGWQVVSLDFVRANPDYKAKYEAKNTGAHLVSTVGNSGIEIIELQGVLGNAVFRSLSQSEKANLARKLGADAYAEFVIIQSIDQGWSIGNLTGNAAFSYTSRANLMVYDLNSDDPIWRIQNVDGDKSDRSDTLPEDMPRNQKLAKIGLASANSAIAKLVESYSLK